MTRRRTCLALLIAFLWLPGLRAAGPPPAWRPIGPYGAHMTALLTDPKRPGVVFAGTDAGLYRSLNGGTTWLPVLPEGPLGGYIGALEAGPASIYAASDSAGLFESHDGGTTWALLTNAGYVTAIAADRARSTLFILTTNFISSSGLQRSTDGGKHWSGVNPLKVPCPMQVAADHGAPGTFYVGTCTGRILRTTDSGSSWTSSDLSHQLGGSNLHTLAVDPITHTVYTGGTEDGIFYSTDRGVRWHQVVWPNRLAVGAVAAQGGVVYAAAGTYIFLAPVIQELFVSTNGGKTWRVAPQDIGNAAIEALAIDPRKPQSVYIGAHSWGVFKSSDAAVHWTLANQGLRGAAVNCVALDASHSGTVLAGTDGAGLWKTSDGGGTWSLLNASLGSVQSLALDPRNPAKILAAGNRFLQRSQDGGAHWTPVNGLGSTVVTGPLSIDPQTPDSVYVLTLTGLSHSSDGGATWSPPVPVPQCTVPSALVASPDGTVYLGGKPAGCPWGGGGGVYASTDRGITWRDLWESFGDVLQLHRRVNSLALDPADPLTLYVGGFALSFSTDGGATWQDTATSRGALSLALGVGEPPPIYVGSIGEVDISTDGGASWTTYFTNPTPESYSARIKQLAYDATTGSAYAATEVGLYTFATH